MGGRSMPEEVDSLASRSSDGTVAVAVWRHTDDQYRRDEHDVPVQVSVTGLDAGRYTLRHLRIDAQHSNSHTVWTELGSPQDPSAEQLAAIRSRQGLEELEPPRELTPTDGSVSLQVTLPLPSVSLLLLEPG
jgi:xylan 1,4-beta-xylosidase